MRIFADRLYGSEDAVHELILLINPTSEDAQIALPVARTLQQVFSEETLRIIVIFNPQSLVRLRRVEGRVH